MRKVNYSLYYKLKRKLKLAEQKNNLLEMFIKEKTGRTLFEWSLIDYGNLVLTNPRNLVSIRNLRVPKF